MTGVHWLWAIQLALEFSCWQRSARIVWRRMYPSFFIYLGLDITASVFLFWLSLACPYCYDIPWRLCQVLLAAGRVALVIEAYQNLSVGRTWRFPLPVIVAGSTVGALVFNALRSHGVNHWSSLEGVWVVIGFINIFLGLTLLGITRAHEIGKQRGPQFWHARILWAYLLLMGMLYYAASEYPDTIGDALMVSAGICYGAWLYCMVRLVPARGQ
jgi:hypothetical protein